MVTDQKHSSDSTASEQEVIRHTKKLAQIFGLNEQNAEVYSALFSENRALEKRLDDYYSQHKGLKKEVNRLGKYIEERVDCLKDDVDELFAKTSFARINTIYSKGSFKLGSKKLSQYKCSF